MIVFVLECHDCSSNHALAVLKAISLRLLFILPLLENSSSLFQIEGACGSGIQWVGLGRIKLLSVIVKNALSPSDAYQALCTCSVSASFLIPIALCPSVLVLG